MEVDNRPLSESFLIGSKNYRPANNRVSGKSARFAASSQYQWGAQRLLER
jgi:hypothetical protein